MKTQFDNYDLLPISGKAHEQQCSCQEEIAALVYKRIALGFSLESGLSPPAQLAIS